MIIGIYTGMIFSLTLVMAGITNIITGRIFRFFHIIMLLLYIPAAHYSGLSTVAIGYSFLTALLVMALVLVVSALMANAIPMNIIYFIGSVTPWIGTGEPLAYFLVFSPILTLTFTMIEPVLRHLTHGHKQKTPPIGLAIAVSALFSSPFAAAGLTSMGIF